MAKGAAVGQQGQTETKKNGHRLLIGVIVCAILFGVGFGGIVFYDTFLRLPLAMRPAVPIKTAPRELRNLKPLSENDMSEIEALANRSIDKRLYLSSGVSAKPFKVLHSGEDFLRDKFPKETIARVIKERQENTDAVMIQYFFKQKNNRKRYFR